MKRDHRDMSNDDVEKASKLFDEGKNTEYVADVLSFSVDTMDEFYQLYKVSKQSSIKILIVLKRKWCFKRNLCRRIRECKKLLDRNKISYPLGIVYEGERMHLKKKGGILKELKESVPAPSLVMPALGNEW